ncbi:MAG: HNH endonuclease [Reichenbachiella sp.]
MPKSVITSSIAQYIHANYLNQSGVSMARQFGISKKAVQRYMRTSGLKVSREKQLEFRSAALKGRTNYSAADDEYIRDHYLTLPIKTIATNINRSFTGVMSALNRMGLTVPEDVRQKNIAKGRIKPGNVPFNKGKKITDILSPEQLERVKETWFKNGHLPVNTLHDGAITTRVDSSTGIPYRYIRISLGNWELLHKVIWQKENGDIPKSHCLRFINGNSLDTCLENLELITQKENYIRNAGSVNLTDSMTAFYMSPKDPEMRAELLKHPELIELKRNQLNLNRKIKKHATE